MTPCIIKTLVSSEDCLTASILRNIQVIFKYFQSWWLVFLKLTLSKNLLMTPESFQYMLSSSTLFSMTQFRKCFEANQNCWIVIRCVMIFQNRFVCFIFPVQSMFWALNRVLEPCKHHVHMFLCTLFQSTRFNEAPWNYHHFVQNCIIFTFRHLKDGARKI